MGSAVDDMIPINSTSSGTRSRGARNRTRLFHTTYTWHESWRQIGGEADMESQIGISLRPLKEWDMEDEDAAWMSPTAMGLEFMARKESVEKFSILCHSYSLALPLSSFSMTTLSCILLDMISRASSLVS